MLIFSLSSKLGLGHYIYFFLSFYTGLFAKTVSKKTETLIDSIKFLLSQVVLDFYKSTVWSWLEYGCLSPFRICLISYRDGCGGLLDLYLLFLLSMIWKITVLMYICMPNPNGPTKIFLKEYNIIHMVFGIIFVHSE